MLFLTSSGVLLLLIFAVHSDIHIQFMISLLHAIMISMWSLIVRFIEYPNVLAHIGYFTSIGYFIYDTFFIFVNDHSQLVFIAHHAIALPMLLLSYYGIGDYLLAFNYICAVELSNILLIIWIYMRMTKRHAQYQLFPFVVCAYIPMRSIIMPVLGLQYYRSFDFVESKQLCIVMTLLMSLIQLMSWYYSLKLFTIVRHKWHVLETFPDLTQRIWRSILSIRSENWLPCAAFILKMYVTFGLLLQRPLHTSTLLILLSDIIHIPIGILYHATDMKVLALEKLDFVLVFMRMLFTSVTTMDIHNVGIYNVYTYGNVLLCIFVILINFLPVFERVHNCMVVHRWMRAPLLVLAYFFSIMPVLSIANKVRSWKFLYFLGGLLWTAKFPELYLKGPFVHIINSLGLMHICIMLGDATLILESPRICIDSIKL